MAHRYYELAFTPAVKAAQTRYGSRKGNGRVELHGQPNDTLGADEAEFIAARDSFYMATVSETGWPYIQHRGGPKGFLKVLDGKTLTFADFRGNTQLISIGNLTGDDRVSLFLMDYPNRTRLKILGHAKVVEGDTRPELHSPGYGATVERALIITVEAFDWNCRQHITPRFTPEESGE